MLAYSIACPDFAHKIAREGLDVPTMQRMLLDWTRAPIERWHRAHWRKFEARAATSRGTSSRSPRGRSSF